MGRLDHPSYGGRVVVLASLPTCCVVCGGSRSVRLVSGTNPKTGATAGSTTRCLHCADQVPVAHLRVRPDVPREESA